MLLSELNRMRMMKATLAYLLNTPVAILTLLPILGSLATAMEALVNAMIAAQQTQGSIAVGAGSTKAAKKVVLLNAASSVGKALLSFANSTNDTDLAKLMTDMLKDFDKVADATFIMRCTTIHSNGVLSVGSLAPYGITAAVLTALSLTIIDYKGQEISVRTRIVQKANATSTIAVLQREVTALLKKPGRRSPGPGCSSRSRSAREWRQTHQLGPRS